MPDFSTIIQTPEVRALVQDNSLERAFHDGLFPRLLFRADAEPVLWPGNSGDTFVQTGVGLITPNMQALQPGTDPGVSSYQKEQWSGTLQQYAASIDTNMPTSIVAIANLFLRNAQQMGMQAGQSLNRLVRDRMYNAALSGQTVVDGAQATVNTIRVARLNGLTRARRPDLSTGSAVRFDPVSTNNPLPIQLVISGPSTITRNITGYSPDLPGDEIGPGTITIDGATVTVVDRALVQALDSSFIVRVGGSATIDGITTSNNLRLTDLRAAVSQFWQNNVPEHADGMFHCHIGPGSQSEVFNDSEFQRLLTSLPDYFMYRRLSIGQLLGIAFFRNSECPLPQTIAGGVSSAFVTPASSYHAEDPFAGELVNASGVTIQRPLLSGQGGIMEYYQDLNQLITEAGITGRVGEPAVNNNGIEVNTDRIQLIIRAPLNRLQDNVATSWKFIGDWPVRTDATTGGAQRYKRFCVIEHG